MPAIVLSPPMREVMCLKTRRSVLHINALVDCDFGLDSKICVVRQTEAFDNEAGPVERKTYAWIVPEDKGYLPKTE